MDIVDLHGSSVLCNENMVPTSSNLCPTMTKNTEASTKIMLLVVVPRMAQERLIFGIVLLYSADDQSSKNEFSGSLLHQSSSKNQVPTIPKPRFMDSPSWAHVPFVTGSFSDPRLHFGG